MEGLAVVLVSANGVTVGGVAGVFTDSLTAMLTDVVCTRIKIIVIMSCTNSIVLLEGHKRSRQKLVIISKTIIMEPVTIGAKDAGNLYFPAIQILINMFASVMTV